MLRDWQTHEEYRKKLILDLILLYHIDPKRVEFYNKSISKLYLLNLDKLHPLVFPLYSPTGRPAKNQSQIIRSFVLMLDQKNEHDIPKWVEKVSSDRILCAICGFDFDDVSSFSSYYDLVKRLWQRSPEYLKKRKLKLRSFYAKPRKKLKLGQKYTPPKHDGIVKKIAQLAIKGKLPHERPEIILQKFLARCVVDDSAKLGLLGDTNAMALAGDGTPHYSGASHYGIKMCDCKSQKIYDCKCPRRYSDPDATWGWDSYRECWYYGDTTFTTTASDSKNDLPIYLRRAQAQRHDSVIAIFALDEVRKLFPQLIFKKYIADSAMDNYSTYELLKHYCMIPLIPLKGKPKYPTDLKKGVSGFDEHGIPLCDAGLPYKPCGLSYPKGNKYRCNFKDKCAEQVCCCSKSSYGRTIYIKPEDDLRLFPQIPRNSDAFKKTLARRTTVERSHKRTFIDYDVESGNCRSSRERFMRETIAAINVHLDAWILHTKFSFLDILQANQDKAS